MEHQAAPIWESPTGIGFGDVNSQNCSSSSARGPSRLFYRANNSSHDDIMVAGANMAIYLSLGFLIRAPQPIIRRVPGDGFVFSPKGLDSPPEID
jgi:hypothetical protein